MFFNNKSKTFGLDISDFSIKIVNLKRTGKFFGLSSWGEAPIKKGIIDMGEIKDEDALSDVIKECFKQINGKKISAKNAIVSLPEKKAFLQAIKMPKMEKEELEKAIRFEAENYIPFPISEVCLDFQIIPSLEGYSNETNVLLVAVPKDIMHSYVSCVKKSGFRPLAFEIESQSISRAIIKNGVSTSPTLIIDFGGNKTSFIIHFGNSIQFSSSIPISSSDLTDALSKTLKITIDEAEKLKIKYGLKPFSKLNLSGKKDSLERYSDISDAMMPLLEDLSAQIKKYIVYYQTHYGSKGSDKKIEKILLCGKGSNLRGLDSFLSFKLKVPVEYGNPWINILPPRIKKIPKMSFEESLGYVTALGLALRGINEND